MEQQSARGVEVFVKQYERGAHKQRWLGWWVVCLGLVLWGAGGYAAWGKDVGEEDRYLLFLEGESAYLGEDGGERLRRLLSLRGFLLVGGIDASTIHLQIQNEGQISFGWRKIQRVYQVPEHYRETAPRVRSVLLFAQAFLDSYRAVLPRAPSARRLQRGTPVVRGGQTTRPAARRRVVRVVKAATSRRTAKRPRVRALATTKPTPRKSGRNNRVKVRKQPRLAVLTTRPVKQRNIPKVVEVRKAPNDRHIKRNRVWMAERIDVGGALLRRPWFQSLQEEPSWWGALDLGATALLGVFPAASVGGSLSFAVGSGRWSGFVGGSVGGWLGLSEGTGLQIQPMVGVGVRLWDGAFSGELRLFALMDGLRVVFRDQEYWRLRGGGGLGFRLDYALSAQWSVFVWLSGALFPNGFTFLRGDEVLATAGFWQARVDVGVRFRWFGR